MNDILKTESAYTGKNVNIVFSAFKRNVISILRCHIHQQQNIFHICQFQNFLSYKTQLYRQQLQECLNVKQFLEKSIESKPVFYDGIYNSLKGE